MLFVGTVISLVFAANIWLNIRSQTQLSEHQLSLQDEMIAYAVEGGMFDALALGNNDVVRRQFKRLHHNLDALKVFVYDFNGKISFSTEGSSVGSDISAFFGMEAADTVNKMLTTGQKSGKGINCSFDNEPFSIVSLPISNEPGCFHCHGGSREILGGISVCSSQKAAFAAINASRNHNIFLGIAGICLVVFLVWLLFHLIVNKRVMNILEVTGKMHQGDFTHEIDVSGRDEISHIIVRINKVNQKMRELISEVIDSSRDLSESSRSLSNVSEHLLKGAGQTSEKSHRVSTAAEEMSSNLNAIVSSMEETASNVSVVASSSEEMNSTVNEISQNSGAAKSVVQKAVEDFSSMAAVVKELGVAMEDIDGVTEEIRSISEQVSLLALNAKIEAARAGEAGRGFAVVAQEISELAAMTNESTVKVEKKLGWMKDKTSQTGVEIENVSRAITDSDQAISAIAAAVEEQSITSQEIAGNIAQVSEKMSVVNENVSQGASVAGEVSRNISVIDQAAAEMKTNSSSVNDSAASLSKMADRLMEIMKRFTV